MKKLLSLFCLLLAGCVSLPVNAQQIVTATITITGTPTDDDTITINANVRTWKNTVAVPGTQIEIDGTTGSAGNLYQHTLNYPFAGLRSAQTAPTVVTLTTLPTTTVSVSLSAAYGTVTYSTQSLASLVVVRVPFAAVPDPAGTNRAYQANQLLQGISDHGTTYLELADGTAALPILSFRDDTDTGLNRSAANTLGLSAQGTNQLTIGPHRIEWHVDAQLHGTNGTLGNMVLNNPTSTNLVNRGNAISSPGSAENSEQFGSGATATGITSLAVGRSAMATDEGSSGVGNGATASAQDATAVGSGSSAAGVNSTAVGASANASANGTLAAGQNTAATGVNSVSLGAESFANALRGLALGYGASAQHTNSVAIGYDSSATFADSVAIGTSVGTTAANQIRLGSDSQFVKIPGNLDVDGSIETAKIGELFKLRFDNTVLANGDNSAVNISTNAFVKISSGPSAAFTIAGIAGGADGRQVTIYNALAYAMTIGNEDGAEATAANRILTLSGADYTTTTVGAVTLIYDAAASRWILISTRD